MLIYLTNAMQHRLLPLFHYALQPGGVLFLGSSETVSGSTDLFSVADKQWKIFRRQDTSPTYNIVSELASVERNRSLQMAIPPYLHESHGDTAIGAQIEKYLLAVYGPVSVVISDAGDVVYVHGRTGMYLEPAPGLQNRNVLEMAREGLRQELAFALQQARLQNEPVIRDPIQVKTNGDTTQVRLTVRRIIDPEPIRGLFLVTFEATAAATAASVPAPTSPRQRRRTRLADLEQELAYTQTHLQNTVEELEAANEELRASNEEAQSTNEELQSANEELESSREELQSLNEELHTVNAELHDKVEALSQANDDIQNLLNSINVATLILDVDLRIKRFTTQMTRVVNLIDADIGRPLSDLASTLNYDRLLADAREVLRTLVFKETEVQTKENTWYLLQIMPYRTLGNSIDGLVLTFVDISKLKATEQIAADLQYANTIVQTVREPLLVLDAELRVVSANQAFYRTFHLQVEQVEQRHLYELSQGQWNIPALRQLLQSVLFEDTTFVDFEVRHTFADVGYKRLLLNARRLQTAADQPGLILLAMEDATDATA